MSFTKASLTQIEKALEWANKWHQTVVFWTIAGAVFALALAVLANMAGFPGFNFVLAATTLIIGIFFLTKPLFVLSVFGIGSLANGLPDTKLGEILRNGFGSIPNFELKKFLGAGWDTIKATMRQVAHALFLLTVILIVLGMFPIGDARFVLPALVVLTGFGLWAALFVDKKGILWYRHITVGILIVATGIIFFRMYDHASKVEQIEEARTAHQEQLIEEALTPMLRKAEHGIKLTKEETRILDLAKKREESRSIVKRAKAFFRGQVIEYQVPSNIATENLRPICGIPPGEYKFELGGDPVIQIKNPDGLYHIKLYGRSEQVGFHRPDYFSFGVMLNGSRVNDSLVVPENGCVYPSFNLSPLHEQLFMKKEWVVNKTTLSLILK